MKKLVKKFRYIIAYYALYFEFKKLVRIHLDVDGIVNRITDVVSDCLVVLESIVNLRDVLVDSIEKFDQTNVIFMKIFNEEIVEAILRSKLKGIYDKLGAMEYPTFDTDVLYILRRATLKARSRVIKLCRAQLVMVFDVFYKEALEESLTQNWLFQPMGIRRSKLPSMLDKIGISQSTADSFSSELVWRVFDSAKRSVGYKVSGMMWGEAKDSGAAGSDEAAI